MVQRIQAIRDTTAIPSGSMPAPNFLADFRAFSSLRMSLHSLVKPTIGRTDFIYQLTLYFPEVATLIDESDFGILPLEIGAMTVATKDAINCFDFHTVRKHFVFIGKLFERADTELLNGIQISYLENLLLGETSSTHTAARYLLPKSLDDALKKSESHFVRLAAS